MIKIIVDKDNVYNHDHYGNDNGDYKGEKMM